MRNVSLPPCCAAVRRSRACSPPSQPSNLRSRIRSWPTRMPLSFSFSRLPPMRRRRSAGAGTQATRFGIGVRAAVEQTRINDVANCLEGRGFRIVRPPATGVTHEFALNSAVERLRYGIPATYQGELGITAFLVASATAGSSRVLPADGENEAFLRAVTAEGFGRRASGEAGLSRMVRAVDSTPHLRCCILHHRGRQEPARPRRGGPAPRLHPQPNVDTSSATCTQLAERALRTPRSAARSGLAVVGRCPATCRAERAVLGAVW